MPIIRNNKQIENHKTFGCVVKAKSANKRFDDKISSWDVLDVLERFEYKCFYCNDSIKPKNWQLDHYHPRACGGLNSFENLVCSCKWCNTMKNALDGVAFIKRCNDVVHNNFLERHNIVKDLVATKKEYREKRKDFKKAVKAIKKIDAIKEMNLEDVKSLFYCLTIASGRSEQVARLINKQKDIDSLFNTWS